MELFIYIDQLGQVNILFNKGGNNDTSKYVRS